MTTNEQAKQGINGVTIRRNIHISLRRFTDYFQGFEKLDAVRSIFGDETEKVIANLKVEFHTRRGYMGVSDEDGHLIVSAPYIRDGDERDIYLDIIHELTHVKQHMNGTELFDHRFQYVERPTEIEAFGNAVAEGRRLGMTDKELLEYLRMERMTDEDLRRLASALQVKSQV
jgi:Zn-dependent peptidase ImmA (M78 family)